MPGGSSARSLDKIRCNAVRIAFTVPGTGQNNGRIMYARHLKYTIAFTVHKRTIAFTVPKTGQNNCRA
eukprot:3845601-Pyramimonas_sp.AAC.3